MFEGQLLGLPFQRHRVRLSGLPRPHSPALCLSPRGQDLPSRALRKSPWARAPGTGNREPGGGPSAATSGSHVALCTLRGSYLLNHTLWDLCEQPPNVVTWHVTLFSLLVAASCLELVLCGVQLVNGALGVLCGDCRKKVGPRAPEPQGGPACPPPAAFSRSLFRRATLSEAPRTTLLAAGRPPDPPPP